MNKFNELYESMMDMEEFIMTPKKMSLDDFKKIAKKGLKPFEKIEVNGWQVMAIDGDKIHFGKVGSGMKLNTKDISTVLKHVSKKRSNTV